MKKLYAGSYFALLTALFLFFTLPSQAIINQGCSDAGTAIATDDSVCYNLPVTLSLSGFTGTIFQWQSFDGSNWVNETGPGSDASIYSVILGASKKFRALVTQSPCAPDTSNEVNIIVGIIPAPSANPVSRCGPGIVSLQGTGNGDLRWYTDPTGGTPIATGSNTSAFVSSSTNLYVEDYIISSGGSASPLQITEVNLGTNDDLEIQNVSPTPLNVTGWKVAISDNYTNINIVNPNVQVLNGTLQPGDILTWTDLASAGNYWGSNMFWNPGAFPTFTGWVLILDDQDIIRDFAVWSWPDANIQAMNTSVMGIPVIPGTIWTGDGINASIVAGTDGLSRNGNSDNNNSSDFIVAPLTINATNAGLVLPFSGFGCSSVRIPVPVTINPSDSISISTTATNLCLSGSATFTASSNNPNYIYSWSPSTGLNTTTGATVISTPPATTTYIVIGDDGNCANVDTITIEVGAPTVGGIASTFQDTVCLGGDTDLFLSGSTGDIQWQSLNGSIWIDETGPGSNSSIYNVTPLTNTTYRAYVSSGSCPSDSSNIQEIYVLSITNPVTTNDTICSPGTVTLGATGSGLLTWYTDTVGGGVVNTGSTYSFNAGTTITYYVEAFAGSTYNIGPPTAALGNQMTSLPNNTGIVFDVIRPVTIDVVYVYPNQTGTVTINLRQTLGGPVLSTYTQSVIAFSGKTAMEVGFSVPVGTGYRMEIASGSVSCQQNTSGATFPYTVFNGPLSITGYCNPNFGSAGIYLYLYDWIVSEGCRSARIPATAFVNALPPVPVITQNFNTLTSSSPTGNQWFLNGIAISGATSQDYVASQTGNYTVTVTIDGCSSTSAVYPVLTIGLNELNDQLVNVFPVPASDIVYITTNNFKGIINDVLVYDISGRILIYAELHGGNSKENLKVDVSKLSNGVYFIEIRSNASIARKRLVVKR